MIVIPESVTPVTGLASSSSAPTPPSDLRTFQIKGTIEQKTTAIAHLLDALTRIDQYRRTTPLTNPVVPSSMASATSALVNNVSSTSPSSSVGGGAAQAASVAAAEAILGSSSSSGNSGGGGGIQMKEENPQNNKNLSGGGDREHEHERNEHDDNQWKEKKEKEFNPNLLFRSLSRRDVHQGWKFRSNEQEG